MASIQYISITMFIKVLLFAVFFPAFHPKRIELARFPCKNESFLTNSISVSLRGHYTRDPVHPLRCSSQPPAAEYFLLLGNSAIKEFFFSQFLNAAGAGQRRRGFDIITLRYDSFSQHAMATESF